MVFWKHLLDWTSGCSFCILPYIREAECRKNVWNLTSASVDWMGAIGSWQSAVCIQPFKWCRITFPSYRGTCASDFIPVKSAITYPFWGVKHCQTLKFPMLFSHFALLIMYCKMWKQLGRFLASVSRKVRKQAGWYFLQYTIYSFTNKKHSGRDTWTCQGDMDG